MQTTPYCPTGLIARPTIQCTHPVIGQTGCWLFSGDNHRDATAIHSPIFADLVDLFKWASANGWKGCGDAFVFQGEQSANHPHANHT